MRAREVGEEIGGREDRGRRAQEGRGLREPLGLRIGRRVGVERVAAQEEDVVQRDERRHAERFRGPLRAPAHRLVQRMRVHEAQAAAREPVCKRAGVALEDGGIHDRESRRPARLDHVGAVGRVPHEVFARRVARDIADVAVHAAAGKRSDVQDCGRAHFLDVTLKPFASAPTLALLAGASLWGVLWYPYRLLAPAGLDGIWSTVATYRVALLAGLIVFPRE